MRWILIAAFLAVASVPATADDLGFGPRHESRAFWLHNQAWPTTNPGQASWTAESSARYSMTYTDAIAARLNIQPGHVDLFQQKIGEGGPALIGQVKGGAAELVLRWHPGE